MKQAWVTKHEGIRKARIESLRKEIRKAFVAFGRYNDDEIRVFMDEIEHCIDMGFTSACYMLPHNEQFLVKWREDPDLFGTTYDLIKSMPLNDLCIAEREDYRRLLDSVPKHYCGDIIITDPCYVLKDGDEDEFYGECEDSGSASHILPSAIARDTIYGDWSCTTFDTATHEAIGEFCADSGMVAVFDLTEVLNYNPGFQSYLERPWTTTVIKGFDGDVWFEIKRHKSKKYGDDYSVHVVGRGKHIGTDEPFSFKSFQTGL